MYNKQLIKYIRFLSLCLAGVCAVIYNASAQDTVRNSERRHLNSVVVTQERTPSSTLSQAPVQVVDIEKIERTGAMLLSDAVKQMAGVTLRDYGGVGGMKTMSARGLGSQFSTLTIDGVAVNDCQNGQVDLGRYMLGNSAFISLSNGQQDEMMLSARSTAAGNVINMATVEPNFMPGERIHLRAGMEGGSFGLLSPSLALEQRLGERLSMSFWGNYTHSNGDYPFTLYYTSSHNDSSSVERREHSSMWLATGDLNLFYKMAPNRKLITKIHYVQGYHELPGPVVFYAKRGSEDTKEKLFFAQTKYVESHKKISFQIIGKYQYTYDLYEDFRAATASRYLKNEYSQQEGYLSGAMLWKPLQGLTASLSSDAALTTLSSNLSRNSNVDRTSWLSVAALQYRRERLDIKGNVLATIISENACDNPSTIHYRKLSPYAGLSVKPLEHSNIRLRYFFKETYRVPNFNEMYYFVMPLDTLHPECATQHNIGITLPMTVRYSDDSLSQRYYSLTIDGYHNNVKDKIIAVPRQNMFLWSTMNLGMVHITGLDISGNFDWQWQRMSLNATLTYSYQKAVDRSDPGNPKTYGHQIPYTPRHSGGATLYFKNPWVNIGYNCMVVGERYYQQQNSDDTRLPAYVDQGITLDRTFELPIFDLRVQLQLLNIFDVQYEVVRSYPMMGRNFRIKAEIKL
ncbi:MAG: TonB-dependent receptor [Bacteroidales bacterium]|nr:TonB-dependent receptor [Bacteroidales bacterium]